MALAAPVLILGAGIVALMAMSKKKTPTGGTVTPSGGTATPSGGTVTPSGGTVTPQAQKAAQYQEEVPKALQLLLVDATTGEINGVPSEEGIQYASGLVTRMRADGFKLEADNLNTYVQKAIAKRPAPATVVVRSIPEALQQELNNVIKYSKDPEQLRKVAEALKKLPNSGTDPNIASAIEMVEELAAQIEAQLKAAAAVQKIDVVINQPTAPVTITTNSTTPSTAKPGTVVQPIDNIVNPPKSNVEIAADAMVSHLLRLQNQYNGKVASYKGKQDTGLVKKFQSLAKLTVDGKPGPGTLVAAAGYGQFNLPLVMYWPQKATSKNVLAYRDALRTIADKIEPTNPQGAASLRLSASAERGQGGISGAMPA